MNHEHPKYPAQNPPERLPTRVGRAGAWLATGVTPAWAGRAIVAVGVLAGVTLVGEPLGLGVAVVLFALGAVVVRLPRLVAVPNVDLREAEPPPRDGWTRVWWAFAAALALVPVLRAAAWVVVPCLVAGAALASLAASGGRRWGELLGGLGALWARVPVGSVLAGRAAARGVGFTHAGPAARGAGLAVVLLAVFVPLLASADAAFAQLLEDAVPTGWSVDQAFARVVLAACMVSLGGALAYVRLCPPAIAARPPRWSLGWVEWALPLGALVVLFAGFVALQLTTLFGGNEHVLETAGLTYAQYARSGFWQLLAVAALTFAVVAAAQRWAREGERLLPALLTALCLLTLVVLASALKRLGLLEETYGFTRLRFAAHAALLWFGALFVLVLAARFAAAWLPRAIVAVTAAAFLLFALADPERRIADANVERFARTGQIDYDYLHQLGADAAPAFERLRGPDAACVRERLRAELGEAGGVAGFNLARSRARVLLRSERCASPRTHTVR